MNIPAKIILIVLIPVMLLGCGLKEEEPEGVIPEGHKSAVNKADSVEGLLQDSQKKRTEAVD